MEVKTKTKMPKQKKNRKKNKLVKSHSINGEIKARHRQ